MATLYNPTIEDVHNYFCVKQSFTEKVEVSSEFHYQQHLSMIHKNSQSETENKLKEQAAEICI